MSNFAKLGSGQILGLLKEYLDHIQEEITFVPDPGVLSDVRNMIKNHDLLDIGELGDVFQDGIIIFDKDANILYCNKALEEMSGIPRQECLGHNASEFAGNNAIMANATTLQVFAVGKAFTSIVIPKRTGRQLLQTGSPICDEEGNLKGAIIIDKDISELIKIKNQLDATQTQLALTSELKQMQDQVIMLLTNKSKSESGLIFESPKMQSIVVEAIHFAKSDATVLILGETGCGKEILADIIQEHSDRVGSPYIKVNCAAIPENLLESELFGYERGAFTGADPKGKAGMFELANGGTLLLDEIGELPLAFQAKLLRALQSRKIIRVGGIKNIDLDVRVIASTNRDLKKMVASGHFREDLYYRVHVLPIQIPPLRERVDDIDVLIRHYLLLFNKKYNKGIAIDSLVYFKLRKYYWPGNVRELENIVERWVVIYDSYAVIRWEQVSPLFFDQDSSVNFQDGDRRQRTMAEIMDDYQREVLLWAAAEYKTTRAIAQALDVDHSTIVKKAKRLGIRLHR